jgi:hypothetical protein
VSKDKTVELYNKLQSMGDVIEVKTKRVNKGDMQVKFKDEKSVQDAIVLLNGMETKDSKELSHTYILFYTLDYISNEKEYWLVGSRDYTRRTGDPSNTVIKPKNKMGFHQTKLGLIKESEDSDEPDRYSSDERSPLKQIEEADNENFEQIEKNISDIIDTNDDEPEPIFESPTKDTSDSQSKYIRLLRPILSIF